MHWSDVAYRAYTTAFFGLFGLVLASGLVGDDPVSESVVQRIHDEAPAWAGLVVAVVVLLGLRSGARGGPLAVEAADVQHLLAAPIERRAVLAQPVRQLLLRGAVWGALVGGLIGDLTAARVRGGLWPWVGCGVAFGALVALFGLGAGLVAAGRRWPAWAVSVAGVALAGWSVIDVTTSARTAPATQLGRLVVWPLGFDPWALLAIPVIVVTVAVAILGIGGLSIEYARLRTALIGQLRFAVTQRDLRTVILLRRQLASETPRAHSWFGPLPTGFSARFPVLARDTRSLARWPLVRLARVAVLGAGAGLALRGAWSGTTPLVLVAGGALYVAALDAIEPLAQELDHPLRLWSVPVKRGSVLIRHVAGPTVVMILAGALGLLAALAVGPSWQVVEVGGVVLVPAALAAVSGATLSVVSEPILSQENEGFMPPELAGPRLLWRTLWPPAIVVLGVVPVVLAAQAEVDGRQPLPMLISASAALSLVTVGVLIWIRYRDDIVAAMADAAASGGAGR